MSTINSQDKHDVDLQTKTVAMQQDVLNEQLRDENLRYQETGGVSFGNRVAGFIPAFRDESAGSIYLSRFANGELAPIHIFDGLPEHLYNREVKADQYVDSEHTVTSGFVRDGRFFTRADAARWVVQHSVH